MEQKLSHSKVNKMRFIREMVFRGLYAVELGSEADESLLEMIAKDNVKRTKNQISLDAFEQNTVIKKITSIIENKQDLDAVIESMLVGWKMERIAIVDLCILRMSIYDLFYNDNVPPNVVISEAVLLAGEFSNEKQKKFINGLLASVQKALVENNNDCRKLIDNIKNNQKSVDAVNAE